MIRAMSSALATIRSNHLRKTAARSLAVLAAHAGKALAEASMASLMVATEREGTVAMTEPSAGLVTSILAPSVASIQRPSTRHCDLSSEGSFKASILVFHPSLAE